MFKRILAWVPKNPIESVLLVKAIVLVLFALYFVLPMSINDPGVISTVFNTQIEHVIIGAALASPGIYSVYGFIKKELAVMHSAAFFMIIAWLFLAILRVVIFGFEPFSGWLLYLSPAVTTMVCYLSLGKMLNKK
jgi:hypothetical protein